MSLSKSLASWLSAQASEAGQGVNIEVLQIFVPKERLKMSGYKLQHPSFIHRPSGNKFLLSPRFPGDPRLKITVSSHFPWFCAFWSMTTAMTSVKAVSRRKFRSTFGSGGGFKRIRTASAASAFQRSGWESGKALRVWVVGGRYFQQTSKIQQKRNLEKLLFLVKLCRYDIREWE